MKRTEFELDSIKLKQAIEEKGLRVDWIAQRVGIHKRSLSEMLLGRRRPSLPTLRMIAMVLGMTDTDFIKKDTA